ncbi:MAG: rhodanese-like domain-containing protein [Cyclobacteriaceae bacterium]
MQKPILLIFTTFIMKLAIAQQPVIVDTDWLAARIENEKFTILHIGNQKDYEEGHIPGAQFVEPDAYIYTSGMENDDKVYDLPELTVLEELLESSGITRESKIIVYPGATSHLAVTRLLFTLDYLGFKGQVSILSGGKAAWKAKGLDLTSEVPKVTTSDLSLSPNEQMVVSKQQVAQALNTQVKIVDCRASVFYNGIDVNKMHGGRKGHIPGAKTIPFMSLFEKAEGGYYQFISKESLADIFTEQGLKKNDEIILYCHIGLQLTSVYTTSQLLGYTNVRVFDGSFHEYGPDTSLPVVVD